jgi:hypothetical protein
MKRYISLPALIVIACFLFSGCSYTQNRYHDFRDIFDVEMGVTFARPKNGGFYILPHSLGAYVEATQFLQLGAIGFNNTDTLGGTAGLDLRSSWIGKEARVRYGIGPFQKYFIKHDGYMSTYKSTSAQKEGIDLCYRDDPMQGMWQTLPYFRGRNYWEYIGAEVAICEPLATHFGLKFRFGFDPCQVIDFCIGWFFLDMYGDDLAGTKIGE